MWTPVALASELRRYADEVWRVVETQYQASTIRITDTLEEQAILEALLETSKPPLPPSCAGLDFLLATPFRYGPYPEGSRFRRSGYSPGVFYASEPVATAIAETAFYRLLFFAHSPTTKFPATPIEHTAFCVPCRTDRALDLTRRPFVADQAVWMRPSDYGPCQAFADVARAADAEIIRYRSVRDPAGGHNIAVLSPAAFAAPRPKARQTWHIYPRPHAVQAWCENPKDSRQYPLSMFLNDPRLRPLMP